MEKEEAVKKEDQAESGIQKAKDKRGRNMKQTQTQHKYLRFFIAKSKANRKKWSKMKKTTAKGKPKQTSKGENDLKNSKK